MASAEIHQEDVMTCPWQINHALLGLMQFEGGLVMPVKPCWMPSGNFPGNPST